VTISAPGLARASTAVRPRAASGIGPAGMRKDSDPATSAPLQAARLTGVRKLLTDCHLAFTDCYRVDQGFGGVIPSEAGGLPHGAGPALPGGARLGVADRAAAWPCAIG
jgi:hypothetical protein